MNEINITTTDNLIVVEFPDGMVLEFLTQEGALIQVKLKKDIVVAEIVDADKVDEIGSTQATIRLHNCTSQADFYKYLHAAREECKNDDCLKRLGEDERSYVFDVVGCQTVNFLYDLRNGKLIQA